MGCAGSKPDSSLEISGATNHVSLASSGVRNDRSFPGPHIELASTVAAGRVPGEILSGGEDRCVALTDWVGRKIVQQWRGHEKGVNCVLPAPKLDGAVSGGRDTTVRQWRVGTPEAVQVLNGHDLTVSAMAIDDANTQLCTGSRDSSLRLWDLATGASVSRRHVSRNVVTCMAWVPGEPLLWQGAEDLRLRLWDVRSMQQPAATLEGYVYFPLACDCNGHHCLTGSNGFDAVGCEVRLWDRRMLKEAVVAMTGHEQAVTGVALLGGGSRAASGSKEGKLKLWDLSKGTCVGTSPLNMFSSGGQRVGEDAGGVTDLGAALAGEDGAQLFASTTTGALHVFRIQEEGGGGNGPLEPVAQATPSDGLAGKV